VGYIEAHGTGTSLGDPIEVEGLKQAFRALAKEKGEELAAASCGIGTIKSNIGHLELAAGVAGVIKVLLQLRHRQLVASLYSEPPNPYINLSDSPFYVVKENRRWETVLDKEGRELPRRAGVSSFGFGGVNAHVVLEEYVAPPRKTTAIRRPMVVVLSAHNEERLQVRLEQLLSYLNRNGEVNLVDLAYTLQVGREALGARLAVVVNSVEELRRKLTDITRNKTAGLEDLYRGEVKRTQETIAVFKADEDLQQAIEAWIAKGKLGKLAELWVQGLVVDWTALYGESNPQRLSLPTYPFAKEHYWITEVGSNEAIQSRNGSVPHLHPLVHRNSSDLSAQRYSTILRGEEFYLRDHMVGGKRIVPGVVQLEWARAAVSLAVDGTLVGDDTIRLEQVSWLRPLVVESALEVHIGLTEEAEGRIEYEIYSGQGDEAKVYSHGYAVVAKGGEQAPLIDLPEVSKRCDRTLTGAESYEQFKALRLNYGSSFQVLKEVRYGDGVAVGALELGSESDRKGYSWPPSLVDGALQASVGLLMGEGRQERSLALPFAVEGVQQWVEIPNKAWAAVRVCKSDSAAMRKVDVAIVDGDGRIALQLSGFSTRSQETIGDDEDAIKAVVGAGRADGTSAVEVGGELTLTPVWELTEERGEPWPSSSDRVIWLRPSEESSTGEPERESRIARITFGATDSREVLIERLRVQSAWEHVIWQVPMGERLVAVMGLRIIQALLALGYGNRSLGLTVVTQQGQVVWIQERVEAEQASVHGLIGSLAKEYPNWRVRLLDLGIGQPLPVDWQTLPADRQGEVLANRKGRWHRRRLAPCVLPEVAQSAYREGGVYILIGGTEGIGLVFSEYLIRRYQAQVIWLGGREEESISQQRARLATPGPTPVYLQADATDRESLKRAQAKILERFGKIHGVVHSANVLADCSLDAIEEADFEAVLGGESNTASNLDVVFGSDGLDFLLFFCSLESLTKAPGQGNCAARCCYVDAYAQSLLGHRGYPVKVMHWDYRGGVGALTTEFYRERVTGTGLGSIERPEAMAALERLLAGPLDRVAFLKTR
jgi:acyl transferase domain-containing protein